MAINIDKFLEPAEVLAATAVPIGGVIMWMSPSAAVMNPSPPVGFEFCDGTAVVTGGSPLLGVLKPNLMITAAGGAKGVARGANVTAAPYGVGTALITGGADVHSHTTNSSGSSHSHLMENHTHSMQSHTHPVPSGGTHDHSFTGTANQAGVPATGAPYQGGIFFHNHATNSTNSAHSHPDTGGPNFASTGGPSSSNTGIAGDHDHSVNNNVVFPVFHTELAYIVRVL